MKSIIISTIAVLFLLTPASGQCKFKSSGSFFSFLTSQSEISPKTTTKQKPFFTKFNIAGTQFFFRSNDDKDFFGFGFYADFSKKFNVLHDNPLILIFEDGNNIELFPVSDFEGIRPGLSINQFQIIPIYSISTEQVELIANNKVTIVKFYLTSEKKIDNTNNDDKGVYYEFPINLERNQTNLSAAAQCLLSL